MEIKTFFDNFALMAEAPGGIQKLREMILQLAVQGKLVPQDPSDEPALVLLEKIRAEKERLVREGKIKKSKQLPLIADDEIPHEIPPAWEWTRLGEIVDYSGAIKVSCDQIPDNAWLLELEDIEKETSRILKRLTAKDRSPKSTKAKFEKDDVLYGKLRPYLNKVIVADTGGFCTTEILPLRGFYGIYPPYIKYVLKRPDFISYANSKSYGMNLPRLGTDDGRRALFPLPPLNEQKRIVKKVDELMALCDELESRRQKAHQTCIQLHDASIGELTTAPAPKQFNAGWKRIRDNFDLLYGKPENVAGLRKAILQLAVQGKLVPQDPHDEPASVLVEKIQAEKERLFKEGKIKKAKQLPPIKPDEMPYGLPNGWEWARPDDFSIKITDGEHFRPQTQDSGVYFLSAKDIRSNGVSLSDPLFISEETAKKVLKRCNPEKDDLLIISRGATVGRICTVDIEDTFCLLGSVILIKPIRLILSAYLQIIMKTPQAFAQLVSASGSTAQPAIYLRDLKKIPFPIAPLEEQKRIVQKVDELMAFCDELEGGLIQSQSDVSRLLESAVADMLAA